MRSLLRLALVTLIALPALEPWAQSFPEKPVTLVVPFNPGGQTDALARAMQGPMQQRLKQTVVIRNAAGAGGAVGSIEALRAAPDGHTLLLVSSTALNSLALGEKLPVHPRDSTFVAPVGQTAHVLVVPADAPVKSVSDLLSIKDKKIVIAAAEQGTQSFVNAHALAALMPRGTSVIPMKNGEWLAALLGGQVTAGFFPLPSISSHVRSGKLRALAVTGPQRSAPLPNVPTMAEAGAKGDFTGEWYVVLAPKGVPPASVAALADAVSDAVKALPSGFATEQGLARLDLDQRSFGTIVDQRFVQSIGGGGTPQCTGNNCYCSATRQCKSPPCENC